MGSQTALIYETHCSELLLDQNILNLHAIEAIWSYHRQDQLPQKRTFGITHKSVLNLLHQL